MLPFPKSGKYLLLPNPPKPQPIQNSPLNIPYQLSNPNSITVNSSLILLSHNQNGKPGI